MLRALWCILIMVPCYDQHKWPSCTCCAATTLCCKHLYVNWYPGSTLPHRPVHDYQNFFQCSSANCPMLQCGICHEEEVDHIGLLDSGCNHVCVYSRCLHIFPVDRVSVVSVVTWQHWLLGAAPPLALVYTKRTGSSHSGTITAQPQQFPL